MKDEAIEKKVCVTADVLSRLVGVRDKLEGFENRLNSLSVRLIGETITKDGKAALKAESGKDDAFNNIYYNLNGINDVMSDIDKYITLLEKL